jgi:hypothetical protein
LGADRHAHAHRLRFVTVSGLIGLLVCGGCSGRNAAGDSTRESVGGHRLIAQEDYGAEWPFGPNQGVLRCRRVGSQRIVTFDVKGTTYALNRDALRRGFKSIDEILVTDHAGLPYDYSPIREDALALCRR